MVKGNICEKCQKNEATITYDIQGWRKWTVCDECHKELQICSKCKKSKATNLIEENKEKKQVCANCASSKPNNSDAEIKDFEEKWEKCLITHHAPQGNQAIEKIVTVVWCQENRKILEPYLQKLDIVEKSFPKGGMCWQYFFDKSAQDKNYLAQVINKTLEEAFGKRMREINDKGNSGIDYMWVSGSDLQLIDFVINDKKLALQSYLRALDIKEKQLTGKWKPQEPNKDKPNIPDKKEPPNDKEDQPKPNEVCEQCGASCIVHKGKTSYTIKRKRYIKYSTDFSERSSVWFGTNCGCAREYREANQQTCSQCQKREFPHMKRGWMLDYEIKKAFCSPDCHVKYRNLSWEEGARLSQIEMFPPELDVEVNPQQNNDWEQEGLKREVLYLRESVKELQRQLEESKKKPKNQQHPNEVPHQENQISYLLNLHQNTQRRAEQAYQSRYGTLNEDGSDKGKGMSGGMIFLIIIGILALVGGLIFLLTRNNKKSKK